MIPLLIALLLFQVNPEANDPAYWCGDDGVKYEPVDTPFIVPEPQEGTTWTLLVLKGGTTNEAIPLPVVGQGYSHSEHANSHVILCWETTQATTTTTTSVPNTTTTSIVPTTTSTEAPTTTTTDPTTTTSSSTTTTSEATTTTSSSPTSTTTSTEPPSTTTVPPTTTTTLPTLPTTGIPAVPLTLLGTGLAILGSAALTGTYLYNRDRP